MKDSALDDNEIAAQLQRQLPKWQYSGGKLVRQYRTSGWKSTLMVVNLIGHFAESGWHHPELEVSYNSVQVSLVTHSASAVTHKDFELALKIEESVLWQPAEADALDGVPDDARYTYIKYD